MEKLHSPNESYSRQLAGDVWEFIFGKLNKKSNRSIHAAAGVAAIMADSIKRMDAVEKLAFEELMREWGM